MGRLTRVGPDAMDDCIDSVLALEDGTVHLSSTGRSFIKRCLEFDPDRRITADQALQHAWLTKSEACRARFSARHCLLEKSWKPREILIPPVQTIANFEVPFNASSTSSAPSADAHGTIQEHGSGTLRPHLRPFTAEPKLAAHRRYDLVSVLQRPSERRSMTSMGVGNRTVRKRKRSTQSDG